MKELSIFIDESGDWGEFEKHCPYYIVTMVFAIWVIYNSAGNQNKLGTALMHAHICSD